MRSAIFNKDPQVFSELKRQSKSRPLLKNSSPSISSTNSPIIRQKSTPTTPNVGEYSKSSNDSKKPIINGANIAWNLDEMVNSYHEHRILPPILSPTIPQGQSTQGEERNINKENSSSGSVNAIASENLPLSMLSPTLPVMFDSDSKEATPSSNYSKLVQPKPKHPNPKSSSKLVGLSVNQPQPSRPKVRWIDKSQDIRPKFLLRINFRNQPKYKESFNVDKADSPRKYNGLGISSSNIDPTAKETQGQIYKEPSQETTFKKPQEAKEDARQADKAPFKRQGDKLDKQQKKEEQLKQLNSDVLQKEQAQLTNLERLRILKSQSPLILNQLKLSFTDEEKEEFKANLILKKNYWIKIARQTKAESDKTKDPILSIVISIDALLLYMISYDYDEKLKLVAELLPLERYWNSLYQDCSNLIVQLKQQISTTNEKSTSRTPLNEYIQLFIGILYQMKAIILKQVNSVFQKVIDLYIFKKKNHKNDPLNELNNKIIELQQSTINNYNKGIANFAKAESFFFMTSQVSVNFPKTWYNKSPHMNPTQTYVTSFVPGGDNYFLPIGMYSELREISGFMFSCLREFSELFLCTKNNGDKPETIYILQSGLKGAPTDELLIS